MTQLSHQIATEAVASASHREASLPPATMARHLRQSHAEDAYCFALEMQEQVAWANEAWGAYWGAVARLV